MNIWKGRSVSSGHARGGASAREADGRSPVWAPPGRLCGTAVGIEWVHRAAAAMKARQPAERSAVYKVRRSVERSAVHKVRQPVERSAVYKARRSVERSAVHKGGAFGRNGRPRPPVWIFLAVWLPRRKVAATGKGAWPEKGCFLQQTGVLNKTTKKIEKQRFLLKNGKIKQLYLPCFPLGLPCGRAAAGGPPAAHAEGDFARAKGQISRSEGDFARAKDKADHNEKKRWPKCTEKPLICRVGCPSPPSEIGLSGAF